MITGLPEMVELEKVLKGLPSSARVETLATVECKGQKFPIHAVSAGVTDPKAPTIGYFAGVHGLERIGTRVAISYLKTLSHLMRWDPSMNFFLTKARIVFVPLINPTGMFLQSRSNANGVDLMRNAPVEAEKVSKYFLVAGHRISPRLPWYRGVQGAPMEVEAQAVCDFVRREIFPASVSIALDIHSGYGTKDRLWFPYAKTVKPFPNLAEVYALKDLLDVTYPNHVYAVEPQSLQYTTHGDLWDFLYDEYRKREENGLFLPLALELGSWMWVKKNPRQLFSLLGVFNPLLPHRYKRALRRHLTLFDFLLRSICGANAWALLEPQKKKQLEQDALHLWYGKVA